MDERVTVAIPTIGRVEMLPTVLTAIAFQDRQPSEVLVLDEAKTTIMESYAVNQALDLLSLQGIEVRVIRDRKRQGIGPARHRLVTEAKYEYVLMVDDDVVLRPSCLRHLMSGLQGNRESCHWAVPTCLLINGSLELDGYTDKPVQYGSPQVQQWVNKYPWFVPYFKYEPSVGHLNLAVAGTQAILLRKTRFLAKCEGLLSLGNLPREDTYLTTKMGGGLFVCDAECLHFEHLSQVDRGNWGSSMFYRLHEAIMKDPDGFARFVGKGVVNASSDTE